MGLVDGSQLQKLYLLSLSEDKVYPLHVTLILSQAGCMLQVISDWLDKEVTYCR